MAGADTATPGKPASVSWFWMFLAVVVGLLLNVMGSVVVVPTVNSNEPILPADPNGPPVKLKVSCCVGLVTRRTPVKESTGVAVTSSVLGKEPSATYWMGARAAPPSSKLTVNAYWPLAAEPEPDTVTSGNCPSRACRILLAVLVALGSNGIPVAVNPPICNPNVSVALDGTSLGCANQRKAPVADTGRWQPRRQR